MISRKIGITPKNDNYARLANYIAAAGQEGEKLLTSWYAGCEEEGYAEGIAEVVDIQDRNKPKEKMNVNARKRARPLNAQNCGLVMVNSFYFKGLT